MNVIHKIQLSPGPNTYAFPLGTELLHVAMQHGEVILWYRRPVITPTLVSRMILLTATGLPFEERDYTYLGTAITEDQNFVFHAFEIGQPQD